MRPVYIASLPLLLLASSPSFAQVSDDYSDIHFAKGTGENARDMDHIVLQMSDPAIQDQAATMVESMAAMLMQLPVGKFAQAIENARPGTLGDDVYEDSTLADLAGPAAQELPATLGHQTRTAMNMMGQFATALAAMLPEFEKLGTDLQSQMQQHLPRR